MRISGWLLYFLLLFYTDHDWRQLPISTQRTSPLIPEPRIPRAVWSSKQKDNEGETRPCHREGGGRTPPILDKDFCPDRRSHDLADEDLNLISIND